MNLFVIPMNLRTKDHLIVPLNRIHFDAGRGADAFRLLANWFRYVFLSYVHLI